MICPTCVALRLDASGDRCPTCGGALLPLTEENHQRLAEETIARRLLYHADEWLTLKALDWHAHRFVLRQIHRGYYPFLSDAQFSQLCTLLPRNHAAIQPYRFQLPPQARSAKPAEAAEAAAAASAKAPEPAPPEPAEAPAPVAAAVLVPLPAMATVDVGPSSEVPEVAPGRDEAPTALDEHTEVGDAAVLMEGGAGEDAGAQGAGALGALVAVEEAEEQGPGPASWLYENIGWFLGATLVLAGSIYGVREAWQALGDVPRHLVVAGALLAYHAGFVAVGSVLARSARGAGRVLASIGWLLLPVVFIGLSSLVEASAPAGIAAAAAALAMVWFTQRSVAARFDLPDASALALSTMPALVATLPVASFPEGSWQRHLAPLLGLVGFAAAARSGQGWPVVAALMAAGSAQLFSLAGVPGEAAGPALTASTPTLAATAVWAAALAGALREATGREEIRKQGPSLAGAADLVSLALAACGALGGALALSQGRLTPALGVGYLVAAATASAVFARAMKGAPRAVHLLVPTAALGALLAAATAVPQRPEVWAVGPALLASALLLLAARQDRAAMAAWGLGLGAASIVGTFASGIPAPLPFLLTVAPLALAAHGAASRWIGMHYAGGAAAALGAYGLARLLDPSGRSDSLAALLFGLTYGAAGLLLRPAASAPAQPLDDLSLLGAVGAALFSQAPSLPAWVGAQPLPALPPPGAIAREVLLGQKPLLAAAALLLVRARLDRGYLVGAAAGLTLLLAVLRSFGFPDRSEPPLLWSYAALALALAAAVLRWRTPAEPEAPPAEGEASAAAEPPRARALFGFVPLGGGPAPVADGLVLASALAFLQGNVLLVGWLGAIVEAQRMQFVQLAAVLTLTAATWFLTPSMERIRARGTMAALVVTTLSGVLIALANRLGRPLPPEVVALRFTIILAILWAAGELLERQGRRVGGWLGRPEQGAHYHKLATVGLGVMTMLQVVDALLLLNVPLPPLLVVPPLFALGAALGALLLARRLRAPWLLNVSAPLLLAGLALSAAQHTPLGLAFTRLADGSWVPAALARKGVAIAMLDPASFAQSLVPANRDALLGASGGAAALGALALLARRTGFGALARLLDPREGDEPIKDLAAALGRWAALGVVACAFAAGWQSSRASASAMALTGALLVAADGALLGALLAGAGLALLIHAQAFQSPLHPLWPGPALAALGLAALGALSLRKKNRPGPLFVAHVAAFASSLLGLEHALAVGAPTTPAASLGALQRATDHASAAGWLGSPAPAAVLLLTAATTAAACFQAHRTRQPEYARLLAAAVPPLAGLGATLGWLAHRQSLQLMALPATTSLGRFLDFLGSETTALSALLASLALVSHAITRRLPRPAVAAGAGLGRDALLVATFSFAAWHVSRVTGAATPPAPSATLAGVAALAVVALVSVHAAWRESSARHVYFVQIALVSVYGVLRSTTARAFPPEADAIFALGLGFLLVGVTVMARRAGLPPVAQATKVFAALLPIGVAIVLGNQQGYEMAAGALGSAMLYGALAWVERSRALGAIGAIAANLALLLTALASGLDGLEIYLAPLGLFLLAMGHLFSRSLEPTLRQWLRILGTLLLYLPAGWSIAFQLGRAPDARYPLAFGAVCLAGVAAGMLLRIRAYLLLGAGFLVLDVVANLVHASLRDHRLGFAILSASGLLVLGAMVLTTVKRQAFQSLVRRYRSRLAAWD